MPSQITAKNYASAADAIWQAAIEMDWVDREANPSGMLAWADGAGGAEDRGNTHCWLRELRSSPWLKADGSAALDRMLQFGWTLRSHWVRSWTDDLLESLGGPCFFWGHQLCFRDAMRTASIVASSGKQYASHCADWPRQIDATLRDLGGHGKHVFLQVENTTLGSALKRFLQTSKLSFLQVDVSESKKVIPWLGRLWRSWLSREHVTPDDRRCIASCRISPSSAKTPLRDCLSIAMADHVRVLALRKHGKLAEILRLRLAMPDAPQGCVYMAVANSRFTKRDELSDWLGAGAVGWHSFAIGQSTNKGPAQSDRLDNQPRESEVAKQLTGPLSSYLRMHRRAKTASTDFLVHCTRGRLGPRPSESDGNFYRRLWRSGSIEASTPFEVLREIVIDRRLLSTNDLTRGDQPTVSFSSVPIVELLRRRQFQPHLKRWDWEPYGFLIQRDYLAELGAARVIYGAESKFLALKPAQRWLFQARGEKGQWEKECEWRLRGDFVFESPDTACLKMIAFTRTRYEAEELAELGVCPTFWVDFM